jgi:hypothetical protein
MIVRQKKETRRKEEKRSRGTKAKRWWEQEEKGARTFREEGWILTKRYTIYP